MTRKKIRLNSPAAARELHSLTSAFSLIRILHLMADTPLDTRELGKRVSAKTAMDPASVSRSLFRIRRHGWLKTNGSLHSLTPAGREALRLAASALKDLADSTNGQA